MNWCIAFFTFAVAVHVGVQVVEDGDVDAAVERPLVRLHVGLDRRLGVERPIRLLDRQIDQGEGADRLALAVFEDLEVFFLEVADELALAVGDERVDLDVLDLGFEGWGLQRGRRLLLLAHARNCRKRHKRRREPHSSNHGRHPDAGRPIRPDYSGYTRCRPDL
jgi:hypothetical protein